MSRSQSQLPNRMPPDATDCGGGDCKGAIRCQWATECDACRGLRKIVEPELVAKLRAVHSVPGPLIGVYELDPAQIIAALLRPYKLRSYDRG